MREMGPRSTRKIPASKGIYSFLENKFESTYKDA